MNRHCKLALTAAALVAISNVGISSSAFATDAKTFSGNGCQAWFGNQRNDFDARHDGVYNTSAGSRWASCPITRDNTTNVPNGGGNGGGTQQVWVYVNHPGGTNSTCILRSQTAIGTNLDSDSRSGNGWISLNVGNSVNWGPYMLYCYIPSGGRLSHYYVNEY
jgi:hypothetical protein